MFYYSNQMLSIPALQNKKRKQSVGGAGSSAGTGRKRGASAIPVGVEQKSNMSIPSQSPLSARKQKSCQRDAWKEAGNGSVLGIARIEVKE